MALIRKQNIFSSLCKRLSLDPRNFSDDITQCDIKTLCTNLLKSSPEWSSLLSNDEVMKWVLFAENFPMDSKACFEVLSGLNDELALKSVLLGNGLKLSEADIIVFSVLHPFVIGISKSDIEKLPHILRWMDYIQHKEDLGEILGRIPLVKAGFEPQMSKVVAKVDVNSNAKDAANAAKTDLNANGAAIDTKTMDIPHDDKSTRKDDAKNVKGDKEATQVKKKLPEKEVAKKDDEIPVSVLNIQVGIILKAWKHPSADSLMIEEIDVGEAKLRQVVSGLAKYCSPDELVNRHVVLITNVKPGKLRDVMSEGLVLCASNEDHSIVQPLIPPEGAKPGERVSISGHEGKPEDVLNPKKKQLEKITPHLFTDDRGVATYKGIPFMTSAGPCTSSIPRATIK
ncbi:hypothetical protein Nepgr_006862 [Nepenthes gracilis]|uniref:tRNA-binding domain-containing protein n=1 Tax=Nepenthes gracilis TaxID=150966 RepID=A0AAD3XHQ6_NEPGR|nr:hypothetical protein Nepgr_006862 [Nepenthes gracilis]